MLRVNHGDYSGAALVGANAAIIGWDVDASSRPSDLMGFAVRRTVFDPETENVVRTRWLSGMYAVFKGLDLEAQRQSDQAPLQRFHWSDFTVNSSRSYRYEIFPMRGRPGKLRRDDVLTFDLRPSARKAEGIGIYTNRGVTDGMGYQQRFRGLHPMEVPGGAAYRWLGNGLMRSLLEFIGGAKRGQSLHVCIYEFFLEEIARALREAKKRGVEVAVVYHAKVGQKATEDNERVIRHAKIKSISKARTKTGAISHNKFVVLLNAAGQPLRLWTASANLSENAFFFQTNVAFTFDARELAAAYEAYFQILRKDPAVGRNVPGKVRARDEVEALNAKLDASPPAPVSRIMFSPVRSAHVVDAAVELISEARSAIFLSAPFGFGKEITAAIDTNPPDVLEYGLANATKKEMIRELRRHNIDFVSSSRSREPSAGKVFGRHMIHAKTLITDPWSDHPSVLTGSANFSENSCKRNDENTILVRGDQRFAAMIATEFMRSYNFYQFRDWFNESSESDVRKIGYLDDSPDWSRVYFRRSSRSRKFREREVFAGRE